MRRPAVPCLLLAAWLGCSTTAPVRPPAEPAPSPDAPAAPLEAKPQQHVLSGRVLRADGTPVAGARVGLSPREPAWDLREDGPRALVETGADGAFQVEALESLAHGVGVLTPEGIITFGPPATPQEDVLASPIELRLPAAPVTLEGTVRDEAGQPLPDVEVRIARLGNPYDDLAYLPRSPDGRYRVQVAPGEYTVVARARGYLPVMKPLKVEAGGLSADLRLERRPDEAQRQAALAWMKQAALPLRTVEAGHGFEDLRPLAKVLQGVQVVALGEATHGTREFFQLKHRMLEFLATELGYTVFAIEADVADAHAVNDYVLTGKGDAARVLADLGNWNTEEVLELLRWMRRYNEDPKHPRKLSFHGVDMQSTVVASRSVGDYLARVDEPFAKVVRERLAPLAVPKKWFQNVRTMSTEDKQALAAFLQEVADRFDARKRLYVRASDARQWARMRRNVTVLSQFMERHLTGHRELRDRFMAENLLWALEHEGPGARAVFWAHNGHVAREYEGAEWPVGRHLAQALGPKLYIFGFAFHQGGFQAWNISRQPAEGRRGMVDFSVPPAPEDTLEAGLASTGTPLLALDLRAVPRNSPIAEWWQHTHRTRLIGFVYSDEGYPLGTVRPVQSYDGLLFVERTTPARPNPKVRTPSP
jgi:erythromycin esterase